MSEHIVDVDDATFSAEVEQAELPVLIDFWAPWCGPCRTIAPMVEELAKSYAGRIKFVKVNVDVSPEVSKRFGVKGIPTLIVTKGGAEIERALASTKTRLNAMLERHGA
jgi:thioredoxin 1